MISHPAWIDLSKAKCLREKYDILKNSLWSVSTQFDEAVRDVKKNFMDVIKDKFTIFELEMPRIIFWNLRGNTVGFPSLANSNNMTMLSGYSPSLLKYVLEDIIEPEPETEIVVPTPLDTYNRIMNDRRGQTW